MPRSVVRALDILEIYMTAKCENGFSQDELDDLDNIINTAFKEWTKKHSVNVLEINGEVIKPHNEPSGPEIPSGAA